MTDAKPTISQGDTYVVIYSGGPDDGQTDTRISTDGDFDSEITVLTAVDGKETMMEYVLVDYKEVGGEFHATYRFDAKDSEPVEDPEDRATSSKEGQ